MPEEKKPKAKKPNNPKPKPANNKKDSTKQEQAQKKNPETTNTGFPPPPPDVFDPEYPEYFFETELVENCAHPTISLPTINVRRIPLGQINNIDELERLANAVAINLDILLGSYSAMVRKMREIVDNSPIPLPGVEQTLLQMEATAAVLDTIKSGINSVWDRASYPPPPSSSSDVDALVSQMAQALTDIQNSVDSLRNLDFSASQKPNPFPELVDLLTVQGEAAIRVAMPLQSVAPGTPESAQVNELGLLVLSRMDSSYSAGSGAGTNFPGILSPEPFQQAASGTYFPSERPWYAKFQIPTGIKYRPFRSGLSLRDKVNQLGAAGAGTNIHWGTIDLPASRNFSFPLQFVGNYGRSRIILHHSAPDDGLCVSTAILEVRGPYEEEIEAQENARNDSVNDIRLDLSDLLSLLDSVASAMLSIVGIIPGSSLVTGPLNALKSSLNAAKTVILNNIRNENAKQHRINMEIAEIYPERSPVGGAETD